MSFCPRLPQTTNILSSTFIRKLFLLKKALLPAAQLLRAGTRMSRRNVKRPALTGLPPACDTFDFSAKSSKKQKVVFQDFAKIRRNRAETAILRGVRWRSRAKLHKEVQSLHLQEVDSAPLNLHARNKVRDTRHRSPTWIRLRGWWEDQ